MTEDHQMDSNIPGPEVTSKRTISPIWILPLVALLIASWLVYKSVIDAGINATIRFENAQGIEKGKTRVIYRGMPIGIVKDLSINKDFRSIDVTVEFVKEARKQLREKTKFWMVAPTISPKGITGLETILKGVYITMQPGDGSEKRQFVALSKPPPIRFDEPGLHIHLISDVLGSLSQGSGVFYKGIRAGEIQQFDLNDKGKIVIDFYIEKKYASKVKKSSQFFNVSGVSIEGSFSGFKINAEALSSLVLGGVAFVTPDGDKTDKTAVDGDSFTLFQNKDLAEQAGKNITLLFDDGKGLSETTQIRYRGVEIGRVFKVELNRKLSGVQATASVQKRYRSLLREGAQFWLVEPELGLAGAKNLETIISGTYITIRPGKGAPKRTFKTLSLPPSSTLASKKGLEVVLVAKRLGSLKANDPVYFRQIKVGKVTGTRLSGDSRSALISVAIQNYYAPLVRIDSKFWNASGIKIDFGLFKGAKVRTESMQSILEGGVAFATPEKQSTSDRDDKPGKGVLLSESGSDAETKDSTSPQPKPSGKQAKNGTRYTLYNESKDEWLKWRPKIVLGKKN